MTETAEHLCGISVRLATVEDASAWDAFVLSQSDTPAFARFGLAESLKKSCGAMPRLSIAYCKRTKEVVGILAAYVIRDMRGGKCLFGPGYGLIADNESVAEALLSDLTAWCRKENILKALINAGYRSYSLGVRHIRRETIVFDIDSDGEKCWRSLRDKTRNSVRKGQKSNLVCRTGDDLVTDFYQPYSDRLCVKGIPFLPQSFFAHMALLYGVDCRFLVAYLEEKPVGGMCVITGSDVALYIAGGVRSGFEKFNTAHFLMWEAIELCRSLNITRLDMGESQAGSGVYRFKTLFGGAPKTLHYYDPLSPPETDAQPEYKGKNATPQSRIAQCLKLVISNLPLPLRRLVLVQQKRRERLV